MVKDEDAAEAMSDVSVFDVPPPAYPLRVVVAVFELKGKNTVDVFFH